MHGLLVTLLFLHLRPPVEAACPRASLSNQSHPLKVLNWEQLNSSWTCMNISGNNITGITGIPQRRSPLKELDLSHNSLCHLPVRFLNHTQGLERLFLQSSGLCELPPAFFENTDSLKEVRLEGNPQLPSVPATLFRLCLETLSVDCRCDVAGSISSYCQGLNCTSRLSCHCFSPEGTLNVTDFYAKQCRSISVAVYIAVAVSTLVVLLGVTVAGVLIQRKKGAIAVQEKRESSASNGAQPRYISHTGPQVDPAQDTGAHADYENIFIGQTQQAGGGCKERSTRKQPKSRSHREAPKDEAPPGEQPIYANTQDVYYNYVGTPAAPLDEDFYILPDQ